MVLVVTRRFKRGFLGGALIMTQEAREISSSKVSKTKAKTYNIKKPKFRAQVGGAVRPKER